MRAAPYIREFWNALNTPDNFWNDWYGEVTNQVSHTALAAGATAFFCAAYGVAMGEMPFRWAVFLMLFLPYLLVIEGTVQYIKALRSGKPFNPADGSYDAAMFGTGIALVLVPFYELGVDGKAFILQFRADHFLMVFAFWAALLAPRIWVRLKRAVDAKASDANEQHG